MRYLNFDLDLFNYQTTDGQENFQVRVASSPAGEQRLLEAETSPIPNNLRKRLSLLEKRALDAAEMISLGSDLGGALFPSRARLFLDRSRERLDDDEGLRIRLKLDSYPLADLPWEYAYLPDADTPAAQRALEGFLVLDRRISLVRYEILGQAPGQLDPLDTKMRLVALFSNPANPAYPSLNLASEQGNLEQVLTAVPQITTSFYSDATVETLLDAIIGGLHIFHFAGHGTFQGNMGANYGTIEGEGSIVLMGDDGQEVLFPSHKLAMNLKGKGVRLVVLGACEGGRRDGVNAWTGIAPALTRAGIPAVIGMQYKINDKNAVVFSRSFYRSLAAYQSIDEAMTAGRLAMLTCSADPNERDWGVPVLYLHAEEGVLFPEAQTEKSASQVAASTSTTTTSSSQPQRIDARTLRTLMIQAFSIADLELLCADIESLLKEDEISEQVNLEIVGGSSKTSIILNLIQYLDRRGQLPYLVKAVRSARPGLI
ncbi:MAG: CHAT domain-containing protein [Acidobacteriota bacterium]